jgi:hypothetical protein
MKRHPLPLERLTLNLKTIKKSVSLNKKTFIIPNTGYKNLPHTTMLLNRIPLFTHVNKTDDKHYATTKRPIVRMNKYGTSILRQGCLTPLHRNIIDLLLAQPEKYGTHTTIVDGLEYRSCVFSPANLLNDLGDVHKSKEWLLDKLREMRDASFILKPNYKFQGASSTSEWNSLLISVFNEVKSYGEEHKNYLIEVHFQISFLELWKRDMTLNFSPLLSKLITIDQPWLQNIIRFVLTQKEVNQCLHSLFFDTGLYCDWSINWLKCQGMLPKDFVPNEADKISYQQYREYINFIKNPAVKTKLDCLFGHWPEGQTGTHSTGKGIHISLYSKTAQDCVVYFKRKEDAIDENNRDLIIYGHIKNKEELTKTFEQIFEDLIKEFTNVSELQLLLTKDIAKESFNLLPFMEQKRILILYLDWFKEDLKTKQRLSSAEDTLLEEANHKLKTLEQKINEQRNVALKRLKTKMKSKESGHYRTVKDVVDEL